MACVVMVDSDSKGMVGKDIPPKMNNEEADEDSDAPSGFGDSEMSFTDDDDAASVSSAPVESSPLEIWEPSRLTVGKSILPFEGRYRRCSVHVPLLSIT